LPEGKAGRKVRNNRQGEKGLFYMSGTARKQQIEAMLAEQPNDPFLRYALAMEHVSAGQDDEAAACLTGLLRIDPSYVPAYLQAGRALMRLGRDAEAGDVLRLGIAAANKSGDSHAAGEMTGFLEEIGA
jgi:Tfp pilus assembly protein PilF